MIETETARSAEKSVKALRKSQVKSSCFLCALIRKNKTLAYICAYMGCDGWIWDMGYGAYGAFRFLVSSFTLNPKVVWPLLPGALLLFTSKHASKRAPVGTCVLLVVLIIMNEVFAVFV